jgi:5-methyltetrahydrofolate--homocysteine methyltransferase
VHTAVKIAPEYTRGPVVHVVDASRAVGTASQLLGERDGAGFAASVAAEYERLRAAHASRSQRRALQPLPAARDNRLQTDWSSYTPPQPSFQGLCTLATMISPSCATTSIGARSSTPGSWRASSPPFSTTRRWARRPATSTRRAADAGLHYRGRLAAAAPSSASSRPPAAGDDVLVFPPGEAQTPTPLATVHFLRQQMERPPGRPNLCLADYIAPQRQRRADYLGFFAVTAGLGLPELVRASRRAHDDYSAILAKALADRLAEAFAERLHQRVRREFWGYAPDEALDNAALIAERLPGHPAGAGLPGLSRPHGEGDALPAARRGEKRGDQPDEQLRHAAGGLGQRLLLLAPGGALLRRRPH